MRNVPTYQLYGEDNGTTIDFWLHCETLYSRSSLHHFDIGRHRHESFLQILYIRDGFGDATFEAGPEPITTPAVILVPPGFAHGFRFSRDVTGTVITVLPAALSGSVQALIRQSFGHAMLLPLADCADLDTIDAAMTRIGDEQAVSDSCRTVLLEGQIATVIALLARVARPTSPVAHDISALRLEKLMALISAHIREQPQADFYARQIGLSPTHLNRIVKAGTGLTLQGLIAARQIDIAKQELIFTASSVQFIASSLGFADPAYFNRFFRRATGMTPRAWRLAERKKLEALPV
ncbi:MAG: AraC family transcriptional regulator [Rhizobiales bacterium 63-7]|nr:helix-turn-helix domain-containing protein [Hyphomicrobiales bacterium]OJU67850.1 MAG: AraC family transcriptional regulator [Rhizobiales bacterium 63-7]